MRELFAFVVGSNLIVATNIAAITEAAKLNGRLGWVESIGYVPHEVDLTTITLSK